MKEIDKLQPRAFTKFCMSIGAVPSSYLEALSVEGQLLWFCSYLEKDVIPAVNNNGQAVTELQNLYLQLKDYVDNYFDNLDVQEEINNKLDDMAESGELADIIAQYIQLQGVLAYGTLAEMKAAENLIDGSIAKTLGNLTYNDGKGEFYKVRQIQNTDVVDDVNIIALSDPDLIAEKINNFILDKKIFYFDNVEEMKESTYLYDENVAKTLGYYNINDGGCATYKIREKTVDDVIDEMFIIEIDDNLVAELIIDESTNILQLGAKNNDNGDNSTILQGAIDKLDIINIPNGNYRISQSVELKPNKTYKGQGQTNLLINNDCQLYLSENASSNYSLKFYDIGFRFNGERSTFGLELKDMVYSTFENCLFRSDNGTDKYNGINIIKSLGEAYDNTISNCFFQKSCLTLNNATDNIIINNKIWSNDLNAASIDMVDNCGNCLIKGNHIIGGTQGGIKSSGNEKILLRIVNNYFDGRSKGICGTTYRACTISNNTFFNMTGRPVEIQQLFNSNVSSNSFFAKNIEANYDDFVISYNHGSNIISNNTHYREDTTTTNKMPYNIVSNTPIGTTLISQANIMYNTNFATQTSFTNVVFKDCYPTAKFPNT